MAMRWGREDGWWGGIGDLGSGESWRGSGVDDQVGKKGWRGPGGLNSLIFERARSRPAQQKRVAGWAETWSDAERFQLRSRRWSSLEKLDRWSSLKLEDCRTRPRTEYK
jgi:hypothetical protein